MMPPKRVNTHADARRDSDAVDHSAAPAKPPRATQASSGVMAGSSSSLHSPVASCSGEACVPALSTCGRYSNKEPGTPPAADSASSHTYGNGRSIEVTSTSSTRRRQVTFAPEPKTRRRRRQPKMDSDNEMEGHCPVHFRPRRLSRIVRSHRTPPQAYHASMDHARPANHHANNMPLPRTMPARETSAENQPLSPGYNDDGGSHSSHDTWCTAASVSHTQASDEDLASKVPSPCTLSPSSPDPDSDGDCSDHDHPFEDYHNPHHTYWDPYYVDPYCQGQLVFDLPYGPDQEGNYHTANNLCAGQAMNRMARGEGPFANCCLMRLQRTNMTYVKMATLDLQLHKTKMGSMANLALDKNNFTPRQKADIFLNYPGSSCGAKLWAVFTTTLVLLSVLVFSTETTSIEGSSDITIKRNTFVSVKESRRLQLEEQLAAKRTPLEPAVLPPQTPAEAKVNDSAMETNSNSSTYKQVAFGMEFTTVGILTAELLLRFAVCSDKKEFLRSPLNVAEFLSFVISIVLLSVYQATASGQQSWYMIAIVVVMKIVRLFRLARVLRNYPPIKVIMQTILGSSREIALLYTVVFLCTTIYATLMFFVEIENDMFMSIPEGYWWAVTTLTTVGYGDYVPQSALGMLVGSLCSVTGILLVVIIVPIISNNFVFYYEYFYRYDAHPNWSPEAYSQLLARERYVMSHVATLKRESPTSPPTSPRSPEAARVLFPRDGVNDPSCHAALVETTANKFEMDGGVTIEDLGPNDVEENGI